MAQAMISWTWENAEKIGSLAIAMGVPIAIIAIFCASRSQREATAKDIYRDYLKLAVANPRLANPRDFEISKDDRKQLERYRWFVAFMMNSCDEIARTRGRDEGWRNTIIEDLKMHIEYLRSPEFVDDGGWGLYSRRLKDIYDRL
jgi:hypothetical protein